MPTVLRETYPTARKEHICEFCAGKIQKGQKYDRQTNVYDGSIYDFITHQECSEVAHELMMYDDYDDSGLDGESFRSQLYSYIYDKHIEDIYTNWKFNRYEIVKKVLKELKMEK